jgi:hypothetical protein
MLVISVKSGVEIASMSTHPWTIAREVTLDNYRMLLGQA